MKRLRRSVEGMSLLETMLVMVLGAGIIMLGLRQYQSIKIDSNVQQVIYNADQIFQAAAFYYQANCRRQIDPLTGAVVGTAGTLDPASSPANPFPVTVADLRTAGFLVHPLPLNPIVKTSGLNGGYMVQFNKVVPVPDRTMVTSSGDTVKLGQITMWRVQVAVQLAVNSTATQYKNLLQADCLSTLNSLGTGVTPCSEIGAVPTGGIIYAVWERLPSYASPQSDSNLWVTNAAVKMFKQLYEAYPDRYLAGLPTSSYPSQNYLCGS